MPTVKRRDIAPVLLLAAAACLHRLLWLHADPSGPFINMDEGLHNNDARSIVLYGTPFYDSYNPSALMPLFTWLKVPFLALFGVNLYGMRIPSVLACSGGALLLAWALLRRREGLAAALASAYCALSFFDFCHARIGIQDPVLGLFAAAAVFFMDETLRSGARRALAAALLLGAGAPFIKTSGVFVPLALALGAGAAWARGQSRLRGRDLAKAAAPAATFLLLLFLFWLFPHRDLVRRYYMWEVAGRRSASFALSAGRLLKALALAVPVPAGLALLRLLRLRRRQGDALDTLLYSWLLCAGAALTFSSLLYWRWVHWLFLPLVALGARELAGLAQRASSAGLRRWAPAAATAAFLLPLAVSDLPQYLRYYRTMAFYIWEATPQVEAIVGDSVVSGSGFDAFAANSSRLNHVSDFDYSRLASCWEVGRAFPTADKTPRFVSLYGGADPKEFPKVIESFYKGCPEWAAQYRVWGPVKKLYPRGADLWFVRKEK